jgi:hypothetical protein
VLVVMTLNLASTEEQVALAYDQLADLEDVEDRTACAAEARSAADSARRYAAHLRNDLVADPAD